MRKGWGDSQSGPPQDNIDKTEIVQHSKDTRFFIIVYPYKHYKTFFYLDTGVKNVVWLMWLYGGKRYFKRVTVSIGLFLHMRYMIYHTKSFASYD